MGDPTTVQRCGVRRLDGRADEGDSMTSRGHGCDGVRDGVKSGHAVLACERLFRHWYRFHEALGEHNRPVGQGSASLGD